MDGDERLNAALDLELRAESESERKPRTVEDWKTAADGLRLVGTAVTLQLTLATFGALVLWLQVGSKEPQSLQSFSLFLGLGVVCAQVTLAAGALRFSKQPSPGPGVGHAQFAIGMCLLAICCTLSLLVKMFRIFSLSSASSHQQIREALEALKSIPTIETIGAVAGFVTLASLLLGMHAVADNVSRPDLVRKIRVALGMVGLSAIGYVVLKMGIEQRGTQPVLAIALGALGLQFAALVSVLRSTRALGRVLLAPDLSQLPTARVLEFRK